MRRTRGGRRLRKQIARDRRRWLWRNRRLVAGFVWAVAIMCGLVWVLIPDPGRGFLVGVFAASAVWAVLVFGAIYGGWLNDYLGQLGEENTDEALKPLRALGFETLHNLAGDSGDIDHVALAEDQVLVIETKWRTTPWDLTSTRDTRDVTRTLAQVRANACHVQQVAGAAGVEAVVPIVVLWGPPRRYRQLPHHAPRSDVLIVAPQGDANWIDKIPPPTGQRIDVGYARRLLEAVPHRPRLEEVKERPAQPRPDSNPAVAASEPKASLAQRRQRHPRAYSPWPPEEDEQLRSEFADRVPMAEIARVHERKESAIRSRLVKLELIGRDSDK